MSPPLVSANQSRGHAGHGFLACPVGRCHMKVDAAAEVEAALERRGDVGSQLDLDHGSA